MPQITEKEQHQRGDSQRAIGEKLAYVQCVLKNKIRKLENCRKKIQQRDTTGPSVGPANI